MTKYTFAKTPSSKPARSFKRTALKFLSTVALWAFVALLTKHQLGVADWRQMLQTLTTGQLILLLICVPVAIVLVQFTDAFLAELNELARGGGKSAAQLVGRMPRAVANVFRRGWRRGDTLRTHWFFTRRYRRRIYEDYGLFNDRGLGLINAARLDLEKVYVDLKISSQVAHARSDLLSDPVNGCQPIWQFLSQVKPGRGLALLGAPGSGKTTMLQYLLLVFAAKRHAQHKQSRALPILIELRLLKETFEKNATPGLPVAIRDYWAKSARIADVMREEPAGWLEQRLRSGRVLLLLDGLDEVPQALRAQVSKWVEAQIGKYRACKFVLTSRPGGYVAAPLTSATVLEVQPFTRDQIGQFIDGWYLANEIVASGHDKDTATIHRRAEGEANDLRRRLRENANLQDLTVNPLLLTMVCMVHRYHGALPGSRSQLYGEICQVLLERWRQAKDIPDDLNGEQKLSVLRPLAHQYMQRETREMPERDILKIIRPQLVLVGYQRTADAEAGTRFLRTIQFGSGLLLEKEAGVWSFAHKTFQEYLTSEYWLRDADEIPGWSGKVAQDWWREALLLYAARADASELVDAAINLDSAASWALAFQCLTESHSMNPTVRERAEAKLRQALHSSATDVFMPAARSMHYLRQSEVRKISDGVDQRASLVTNAEYQLFLQGLEESQRALMAPPHWRGTRFTGNPEAPVLGVWPWQAEAYAQSASRGAFSAAWRLPRTSEKVVLPTMGNVFWCDSATLGPIEARELPGEARSPYLPDGLVPNPHIDLKNAPAISEAIGSALCMAPNQPQDVAHALAHSLNVAIAHTFALDTKRAHELAHISSFDKTLVARFIAALERENEHLRELRLDEGWINTTTASTLQVRRVNRPGQSETIIVVDDSVRVLRRQLHEAMSDIVVADPKRKDTRELQWSDSAQSWRNYASCLLTMAMPHLLGTELDDVIRLERSLRLVNDRMLGHAPAHEGIVLVRDAR